MKAAQKQASQAKMEAAARLRQSHTGNKKKGAANSQAGAGNSNSSSAATSSNVPGSDFASISMALQASLQVRRKKWRKALRAS